MKFLVSTACIGSIALSGCAATEFMSRNLPPVAADNIHIYSRDVGKNTNIIDSALASCPEQTEKAQTACVTEAISRSRMSGHALASLIPGCRPRSLCDYDHTTRRRLGILPMYATIVVKDWRVTVDLRPEANHAKPPKIVVTDRNNFASTTAPKVAPEATPIVR